MQVTYQLLQIGSEYFKFLFCTHSCRCKKNYSAHVAVAIKRNKDRGGVERQAIDEIKNVSRAANKSDFMLKVRSEEWEDFDLMAEWWLMHSSGNGYNTIKLVLCQLQWIPS